MLIYRFHRCLSGTHHALDSASGSKDTWWEILPEQRIGTNPDSGMGPGQSQRWGCRPEAAAGPLQGRGQRQPLSWSWGRARLAATLLPPESRPKGTATGLVEQVIYRVAQRPESLNGAHELVLQTLRREL